MKPKKVFCTICQQMQHPALLSESFREPLYSSDKCVKCKEMERIHFDVLSALVSTKEHIQLMMVWHHQGMLDSLQKEEYRIQRQLYIDLCRQEREIGEKLRLRKVQELVETLGKVAR